MRRFVFWLFLVVERSKWPPARLITYHLGHRLLRRLGPARYRRVGLTLSLNPVDLIDRRVIRGEDHEPSVRDAVDRELAGGGVFLDIGANWGLFTMQAAKLPGVDVLAFEPSPRMAARLLQHVEDNRCENVTVVTVGLANESVAAKLFDGGLCNAGATSALTDSGDRAYPCLFASLDALLPRRVAERVRLCKIDVEGYEMKVLEGMAQTLERARTAVVIVEITRDWLRHAGSSAEALYEWFATKGYAPTWGPRLENQYDERFVRVESAQSMEYRTVAGKHVPLRPEGAEGEGSREAGVKSTALERETLSPTEDAPQ